MFGDQTVITIEITALLGYLVHVVVLSWSKHFSRCLVKNGAPGVSVFSQFGIQCGLLIALLGLDRTYLCSYIQAQTKRG